MSLPEVKLSSMARLLEAEKREWIQKLNWDPSSTLQKIETYVSSGLLPGYAAIENDEALAYLYYVSGDGWASIGNLFILEEDRERRIEKLLLNTALDILQKDSEVGRIESHCIFMGGYRVGDIFARRGFFSRRRLYMVRQPRETDLDSFTGEDMSLRPWRDAYLEEAAKTLFSSYRNGADYRLSRCYATTGSCLNLLENIVYRSSIGQFEPNSSFVSFKENHKLTGFILGSTIGRLQGHVVQIAVHPMEQGKGVGKRLIAALLKSFLQKNYRTVSLSVTEENTKALLWYVRLEFKTALNYPIFLWSRHSVS